MPPPGVEKCLFDARRDIIYFDYERRAADL